MARSSSRGALRLCLWWAACGLPAESFFTGAPSLAPRSSVRRATAVVLPAPLSAAPLLRRYTRPPTALVGDEDDGDNDAYRQLGVPEDATYDEIMDAYIKLSEQYQNDPARMKKIDTAKEFILNERLKARMAGALRPTVVDSPFDEKPVVRIPPWVIAGEFISKIFEMPTLSYTGRVLITVGGLCAAAWFSPRTAGTVLMLQTVSGAAFVYNRGTPDVPRDDMGQIGEIRPMQKKPFAFTVLVTFLAYQAGALYTRKLYAAGVVAKWIPEVVLRTSFISIGILFNALFIRAHKLFE